MDMKVLKYDGELVEFDPDRLKGSLLKSGASAEEVARVWLAIKDSLRDGMPTKEIYRMAFELLKTVGEAYAARYSLKRALNELGPTGYVFEKWVARIFEHDGYQTMHSQLLQGHAVTHEIDVLANKGDETLLVECKFRNTEESRVDVKNPMYILSRFKDVQGLRYPFNQKEVAFSQVWLATNTQLSKDAISFAEYYHIQILSWDYPVATSIKRRVDDAGLYPVTCLTTLGQQEKEGLLKNDVIMVKELLADPRKAAALTGMAEALWKHVLKEAHDLVDGGI
ncbi:Restriction endonuclease [bacterium A37T11]|nr:Restriction endonuclease [bacterium A37T11]